jgi:hypothetical protein
VAIVVVSSKPTSKQRSQQAERERDTHTHSLGGHNQILKQTKAIAQIPKLKNPSKPKKLPYVSLHFRQVPLPTRYFGYLLIFEYP